MKKRMKLRMMAAILLAALIITSEQKSLYEISHAASYVNNKENANIEEDVKVLENSSITEESSGSEDKQQSETTEQNNPAEQSETPEENETTGQGEQVQTDSQEVPETMPSVSGDSVEENKPELIDEKKPSPDMMEETEKEVEEETENQEEIDAIVEEEEDVVKAGAVELGEAHIPATFAELQAMDASNPSKEYNISTYQDWLNLQAISQENSLAGYSFTIESNYSKGEGSDEFDTYDFRLVSEFTGIGGETTPFKGSLKSFNANLLKFYMNAPLFQYLSPEAEISHFNLICSNSTAGLAGVLKGSGTLTLENILITGTIVNNSGNAGGLFGTIENTETTPVSLEIKKNGITNIGIALGCSVMDTQGSTSLAISGMNCGGIAGSVQGTVSIAYDADMVYMKNLTVTGVSTEGAAGMLFGLFDGISAKNAVLSFTKDTVIVPKVGGKGNLGGMIGKAAHASISTGDFLLTIQGTNNASVVDIGISNPNSASSGAIRSNGMGGVIGWFTESAIEDDSHILAKDIYICSLDTDATGCLFGLVENSDLGEATAEGKGFEVQNSKAYSRHGYNSGAFIGKYASNGIENTISFGKVSNSWIQSDREGGVGGGVIGVVSLQNNAVLTMKDWNVYGICVAIHKGKGTAGVVGRVEGGTLKLENGTFSTGKNPDYTSTYMSAYRIWDENVNSVMGSILGKSVNADCEITNLNITMGYLNSYGISGGILGATENTEKHHIYLTDITMTGTMYYEKNNTYKSGMIGKVGKNTVVKLDGTIDMSQMSWYGNVGFYNGQIAGVQEQALIYFEEGANYIPSTGNFIKGIDYVGNFGGVYRNGTWGESGKLIENDTVNGTVPISGDTFQIDSVADILRLSIALNSEGAFATNCFDNQTYEQLLAGNYKLAGGTYDLTQTGMVTMQRNYGAGSVLNATPAMFTGSFCGESAANKAVIIHKQPMFQQLYLGLFANVGSFEDGKSAEFRYLSLQESISNSYYMPCGFMGGLSTFGRGNVIVDSCEFDIDMSSTYHSNSNIGYYGGVFGKYSASNGSNLQISNVIGTGEKIVLDKDHLAAQIIAYVEYPTDVCAILPKLDFSNITISGGVKCNQGIEPRAMIGGFIAMISHYTLFQNNDAYSSYTKKATMNVTNLTVSGLTMNNGISNSSISGGLLGFRWTDTEITMKHVKVNDDLGVNTLNTKGKFGGFVYEVSGRMDMEDIQLSNLSVNNTGTDSGSGLLVGEGRYLYLSIKDYKIDGATTNIKGVSKDFDEIVGTSKINESQGGIVSISDSSGNPYVKVNDASNSYKSYENQASYDLGAAVTLANSKTRYYYNLPAIKSRASLDFVINSSDELMLWHLVQYASPVLKHYFLMDGEKYADFVNKSYTIHSDTGVIDLNGYSYYPTSIAGCSITSDNQTKIVFYGNDIIREEMASSTKQKMPYDENRQHYMLHSGLFNQVTACTISNLTLGGTVSKVKDGSGALVVGQILGVLASEADIKLGYTYSTTAVTSFQNIVMDNIWVGGNTDDNWNGYYGLMVHQISAGAKVKFDQIKMVHYNPQASTTGSTKAASALIGQVGAHSGSVNDKVIEINVTFTNMDIADVKDHVTLPQTGVLDLKNSTEADKVLAKASFIYEYQYYEDTCWGLYTFYKADYMKGKGVTPFAADSGISLDASLGLVTMGEEIGDTVEYYDANLTTPIMSDGYGFDYNNYKPYVFNYKTRQIAVNPKPGDITTGCGTYEDPYQIENARQLKSLYYYLKNNTGQLANWKVNAIGDDTAFCSKTSHEVKTFQVDTGFPTREQMNQAYYQINGDIDFSTFYDFIGFGNQTEPFLGVFVGDSSLAVKPVIKLPNQSVNNTTLDSFAFIRYAKGCVIKDLTIELGNITVTDEDGNANPDYIKIRQCGAGVIAYVNGGDNVIDGVSVKGTLKAANTDVTIGGYVGKVNLGSVLLRNMTPESLKEFNITDLDLNCLAGNDEYLWLGGLAGRVLDGFLVYQGLGAATVTEQVLSTSLSSIYGNDNGYAASKSFNIINGTYLDSCGKIKAEISDAEGAEKFTLNVKNEGQLLMAALALNAGCLTYNGEKTETELGYKVGYGADSRCRSGSYDSIGTSDSTNADYLDVVKHDNLNGRQLEEGPSFFAPFLFQYFEFPENSIFGSITEDADSHKKVKSIYMNLDANLVTMNFEAGGSFDMSQFGNAFRGVGAGYFQDTNTFKGNIIGNRNEVLVKMLTDTRLDLSNVALFNSIYITQQSNTCIVKDITVKGKVANNNVLGTEDGDFQFVIDNPGSEDDGKPTLSVSGKTAAGLIGLLQVNGNLNGSDYTNGANYYFENVAVKNLTIRSREHGGGLIGNLKCIAVSGMNNNSFKFNKCTVGALTAGEQETDYNISVISSGDAGGIVGSYLDNITTIFEDCQIYSAFLEAKGVFVYNIGTKTYRSLSCVGGYAGRAIGGNNTIQITGGGYEKISLKALGHMGGIVGVTAGSINLNEDGISTFHGNNINFEGTGEYEKHNLAGMTESLDRTRYWGSFGGLYGYVTKQTHIYNATITNVKGTMQRGAENQTFMAGLAGVLEGQSTIKNCSVGNNSTEINMYSSTDNISNIGTIASGMIGRSNYIITFNNCHVVGNAANKGLLQGTIASAGLLGVSNHHSYYQNCTVTNMDIRGNVRTAGVEGNTTLNAWSILKEVTVSDCELYNMDLVANADTVASGGMIAITYGAANFIDCQVERVIMKGTTTYTAGGYVGNANGQLWYHNGTVQAVRSNVKDSVVMGAFAGGIVGRVSKSNGGSYRISNIEMEGNKIIAFSNDDSRTLYAGGIIGVDVYGNNVLYGDHIKLTKNLIGAVHTNYPNTTVDKSYVGGISASERGYMYFNKVELEDNIISLLDGAKIKDDTPISGDSINRSDLANYMAGSSYGIWDGSGNVTDEQVKKVYPGLLLSTQKTLEEYPESMTEDEMKKYTKKVGMLFGTYATKEAYVTDLEVSYKEELRKYRPVLDVASDGAVNSLTDMYQYRQYYHIVYGPYEDEKAASTTLNSSIGSVVVGAGKSETYNFGALKDIWDDYQDDTKDKRYHYRLFENYNQKDSEGNAVTFEQVYENTYYNETEGYLSPFEDSSNNPIPMLVFDNSELNQVVNAITNMLTNNGGALGNNQYQATILKVTPEKMKVEDGVVSYDATKKASVKADNTYQKEVKLSVNSAGYDTLEDAKNGTFTMLHIEYCWTNPVYSIYNGASTSEALSSTQVMTIDIPIFIKKILEVETHIVGMEGAEYLIDNILTKGNGNLTLLRGIYTAYIEYDYNDANKEYWEKLNKEIYFEQYGTDSTVPIFKNTKMTLIDMRDNNHVYYFKADSDRSSIAFSEFKDSEGNAYEETAIRDITYLTDKDKTLYKKHYTSEKGEPYDDTVNVAAQQYLLLIDSSEMEQTSEDGLSYTYTVNVAPDASNETLLKKCRYSWPPACSLLVTEINGIKGEFLENTSAIGEISEDSKGLAVTYEYKISAQNAYWTFKKSTAGKAIEEYIDIAIYLKDADGNRVNMPPGTMVTFNKDSASPSTAVMRGGSILYNYKDAGNVFNLNSITQNSVISGTIDFDFSGADFTDFQDGSYTIFLELLKTRDKDFPMGGENLDTFSGELYSDTVRRLGFVVETEELMTLGMNGYLPEDSDQGIIDYTMNIDFTDYIPKTILSNRAEFEELAKKYFTVDFTVLKKKKNPDGTFSYEPYSGSDVQVYWGKSDTALTDMQNGKTVVFRFDNERMTKGNRGKDDHVVTYPYTLKVNVDNLLKQNDSITNYKVLAKLYISDSPPAGAEDIQYDQIRFISTTPEGTALEDYFIFTIAKLKTDLDITH